MLVNGEKEESLINGFALLARSVSLTAISGYSAFRVGIIGTLVCIESSSHGKSEYGLNIIEEVYSDTYVKIEDTRVPVSRCSMQREGG